MLKHAFVVTIYWFNFSRFINVFRTIL